MLRAAPDGQQAFQGCLPLSLSSATMTTLLREPLPQHIIFGQKVLLPEDHRHHSCVEFVYFYIQQWHLTHFTEEEAETQRGHVAGQMLSIQQAQKPSLKVRHAGATPRAFLHLPVTSKTGHP